VRGVSKPQVHAGPLACVEENLNPQIHPQRSGILFAWNAAHTRASHLQASPSPLEEREGRLNIDCRKRLNSQPTTQPTTCDVVRLTLRLAVPACLVSRCKTYLRSAVTAEVASSSLVVPAIFSNHLQAQVKRQFDLANLLRRVAY
jgi:hypothetical protein